MPSPRYIAKRQNATSARCLTACSLPRSFATSSASHLFLCNRRKPRQGALPGPPTVLARNVLSVCLWDPLRTGAATSRMKALECTIEKVNYDDCARMVAEEAKHAERGVVIQDTAWEGYEEIPSWIMQGYSTMADEAVEQFEERPTHVFVQAGVGSLAGGVVGYFANKYKKNPPVMVVVEAEPAACLYRGAEAADGEIRIVDRRNAHHHGRPVLR